MDKNESVNEADTYDEKEYDPFEEKMARGFRWPSFGLIVFTIGVIGAIVVLSTASAAIEDAAPVVDKAVQFALSAALVMLLAIVFLIWFLFFSGASLLARFGVMILLVGTITTLALLFEPTQNKGSLWPSGFKLRSAPHFDETLAKLNTQVSDEKVSDLTGEVDEQGETNFHQYFGPNRDGVVNVKLATDWESDSIAPQELWKKEIGAGWSGFAAINGYAVTMEQRGEQELTSCYEIESGNVVWAHAEDARHHSPLGGIGPRSTPTIDPETGNVYSAGATGILVCLNGDNGALVWRKDILQEVGSDEESDLNLVMWGRSASPLIVDNKLIVAGGGKDGKFVSLIAYDKTSGEELWRGGKEQVSYSSPMITNVHGSPQIVIINESSVTGHDVESGKQLWWYPREGNSSAAANTGQPVALPNNRFLLTKGYALGAEVIEILQSESGEFEAKRIWQSHKSLRTKMTSAVVLGDYAYGLNDEVLECVKLKSGSRAWRGGRYGHGQVLLAGDTLLVLTEDGEIVLVSTSPKGHQELARHEGIEGITWNIPCLHKFEDKWYLLIRNAQEVACFEMSTK